MTKLKNWTWLGIVLLLSIGISIALFQSSFFDISKFEELAPDFHYNAISMSAIIGGFLFTGISILISVIDKERIERLWNNSYLDNLYRSAFVGMIANKLVLTYNYQHGTQTITLNEVEDFLGSDLVGLSPPKNQNG